MYIVSALYRMSLAAIVLVALAVIFYPHRAASQATLQISNIVVTMDAAESRVTVKWMTSLPADERIDFGVDDTYGTFFVSPTPLATEHTMMLSGLESETVYHFMLTARSGEQTVSSFDQIFKTVKFTDRALPLLESVRIAYTTGTSVTFQWETDEEATSQVRIGKTRNYTGGAGDGRRTKLHDITVGGLSTGTFYHAQVSSADKDGNTAFSNDIVFTTLLNTVADKSPLTLTDIRPLTPNDAQVTVTSATVSWTTNKLASTAVEYGLSDRLGAWNAVTDFRTFSHVVRLADLKPDTRYYFRAVSRDVFNREEKSAIHSLITKAQPKPPALVISPDRPVVLGFTATAHTKPSALHRAKGSPDIYAILKNQKYRVPNVQSLKRTPFAGIAVTEVSKDFLDRFPFAQLAKADDSNTVYYLYRRPNNHLLKLAIPSPSVFLSYPRNKWDRIVTIDQRDLDLYPHALLIKTRDKKEVYLLQNNSKRPFLSSQAFEGKGFRYEDVVEVNPEHLATYETGAFIE
ncbi:fibronectin type III domain-containing protein [Candidatus Uhrbacteria bacterium]|nr:fibronectin type III domain-containing protein [Candidatus Uhrbacteria bacterium]